MVLGGLGQFALARRLGRAALDRYGRFVGLTAERLTSTAVRLGKGGPLTVALAVATPGIRVAAVAVCGLVGIPARLFALGLTLGSALFLGLHFFLGYVLGSLVAILAPSFPTLWPLLLGLVALAGLAAWVAIRRRQNGTAIDAVGAWTEAACPVCLALGARAGGESAG
jgi:LPXTG-motif cell wall-anchored protein